MKRLLIISASIILSACLPKEETPAGNLSASLHAASRPNALALRATLYYTALQDDYPAGRDAAFRTRSGVEIARVSSEFMRKADIEGSAKLTDGRVLNVDGRIGGERRWKVIPHAYGLDAVGCGLIPFRSAAVDRTVIPLRTRLHIAETVGMPLPDGARHDGTWYAVDTGSSIQGDRIDLFVGAGLAGMRVPYEFGIAHLRALSVVPQQAFTGCRAN